MPLSLPGTLYVPEVSSGITRARESLLSAGNEWPLTVRESKETFEKLTMGVVMLNVFLSVRFATIVKIVVTRE